MTTESHYTQVQSTYEKAYFYSPGEYMDHLQRLVVQAFQLQPRNDNDHDEKKNGGPARQQRQRLLDIGGGTGNFTQLLLDASPTLEAVVIDPFLTSSSITTTTTNDNDSRLRFVPADAEAFGNSPDIPDEWWRRDYHYLLLKEVVHHLDNRVAIFQGMRQGLSAEFDDSSSSSSSSPRPPQLLIITRPQTDIDYPLWPAARDVWAANQPSTEQLMAELRQAGFDKVTHTLESYPCQIALHTWQRMVQERFWSTFSRFTQEELEQACANMPVTQAKRLDGNGVLHFEDRLVFIMAWK